MTNALDQIPHNILESCINETDDFAVENVKSNLGGPFGASIHVYDLNSSVLTMIGDLEANAVLATGMGSAHAEDQAMNPEAVNALINFLDDLPHDSNPVVILSSSGESCAACHSKEEILSRTLIEKGLLPKGNFIVTYGATYEDTAKIAGFNDAPYHEDMQKPKGSGMISIEKNNLISAPEAIQDIFNNSNHPVSVIVLPDGRLIAGYEDRANDLMATSEVSAIRSAAQLLKQEGNDEPWNLEGASLYTSTSNVGPLGYAECQWANITKWVAVDHPNAKNWATQEASDISNDDFYKVIASPFYNEPAATLTVKRIIPFDNKAQYQWKNKEDRVLYNGIELD